MNNTNETKTIEILSGIGDMLLKYDEDRKNIFKEYDLIFDINVINTNKLNILPILKDNITGVLIYSNTTNLQEKEIYNKFFNVMEPLNLANFLIILRSCTDKSYPFMTLSLNENQVLDFNSMWKAGFFLDINIDLDKSLELNDEEKINLLNVSKKHIVESMTKTISDKEMYKCLEQELRNIKLNKSLNFENKTSLIRKKM